MGQVQILPGHPVYPAPSPGPAALTGSSKFLHPEIHPGLLQLRKGIFLFQNGGQVCREGLRPGR